MTAPSVFSDGGAAPPTDRQFCHAFESCTLPNEQFRHRDHIRLAWIYLNEEGYDGAVIRIERSIRRFAAHHGAAGKYHHTITVAWMRLVALASERHSGCGRFDELVAAEPSLLQKATLDQFFSRALLESANARERWVEPDLRPLPQPLRCARRAAPDERC